MEGKPKETILGRTLTQVNAKGLLQEVHAAQEGFEARNNYSCRDPIMVTQQVLSPQNSFSLKKGKRFGGGGRLIGRER